MKTHRTLTVVAQKQWRPWVIAVIGIVVALLAMRCVLASEANRNPGILPPHSKAFGKSYSESMLIEFDGVFHLTVE